MRAGGSRSCGYQSGGGVNGGIIEVDFFDEAYCELVVVEPDVFGGVDAGAAVLAHPPKGEGAEDGTQDVGYWGCGPKALICCVFLLARAIRSTTRESPCDSEYATRQDTGICSSQI